MENVKNKFWVWYIPLLVIVCLVVGVLLIEAKNKETVNTGNNSDAVKFNNEYSELNGKVNDSNGSYYPEVTVGDNNPFVYASIDDIKELFDGGTGVIYFGFPNCPWCRNLVPVLNQAISQTSISKVYYFNILDIRSKITVNDDNTLNVTKGNDFYYYLLEKLDSNLTEYYVKNSKGKEIDTKEKRLYAPTVVFIKEGNVVGMHEGTVDSQEDPYVVLSDSQKEELMGILQNYLVKVTESCDEKC